MTTSTTKTTNHRGTALDELKRPWRAFVHEKKLNASKARESVVDAFLEIAAHVDLDTLLEAARRRNPGVGQATVYRTMKLLEEAGLAHVRHFGSGPALYEVAVGRHHHDHLICESCGTIEEFVSDDIERIQQGIADRHGFKIVHHRHELYGRCRDCRARLG